jgi:hypothetical protein
MARSYESLWLWLGGGLIAVGAALLGVAGGFDAASKLPYSFFTSFPAVVAYVLFGLSLACFGCDIREVPIPYPISGRKTELPGSLARGSAAERPAILAAASGGEVPARSGLAAGLVTDGVLPGPRAAIDNPDAGNGTDGDPLADAGVNRRIGAAGEGSPLDFDVLFEQQGAQYRARVLRSPVSGRPVARFLDGFGYIKVEIGKALDGQLAGQELDDHLEVVARQSGRRLFEARFSGAAGAYLLRSLEHASAESVALRIRLQFADCPSLADVPWELLCGTAADSFFALSTRTPLIRNFVCSHNAPHAGHQPPIGRYKYSVLRR